MKVFLKVFRLSKVVGLTLLSGCLTIASAQVAGAGTAPTRGGVVWQQENGLASGFHSPRSLLWWNDGAGAFKGTTPIQQASPSVNAQKYVGSGKFGSSGQRLILQDTASGGRVTWVPLNNPNAIPAQIGITGLTAPGFVVVGVADFDGDGIDDIVFRSTAGTNVVWHMNANGTIKSSKLITALADQNWKIVGVANINGADKPDLLWHNTATGALVTWHMIENATEYTYAATGVVALGSYAPATYEFKDAGDFDGDGDADLLVMLKSNKSAQIIKSQNSALLAPISLASQAGISFSGSPGNTWTPEVVVGVPANTVVTVSDGGSNTMAAKDLGAIGATTTVSANSEAWHAGAVSAGPADSYFKFTIAAPTQITVSLNTNKVWGFGTFPAGNGASWGVTGGTAGTPLHGQTTSSSLLSAPGTYYFRVQSRLPLGAAEQSIPFGITITGASPASAPVIASDIDPGDKGSAIESAIKMGSFAYFLATDGDRGLWRTDGTVAGTTKVKTLAPGGGMVVNGTTLYFAADGADGAGTELWKSDGTAAGTVRVSNINSTANEGSFPDSLTVFNGQVYFSAASGTDGAELYRSDGTTAGTVLAANINNQTVNGAAQGSDPIDLTVFNNHLVFSASNGTDGRELYRLSTANALIAVSTTNSGGLDPKELVVAGTTLYGVGALGGQTNGANTNVEPFRVNTSWNLAPIEISAGATGSAPGGLTAWGSDVYLRARGTQGSELYRLNTTGATQIADLNPGVTGSIQNSSAPGGFQVQGAKLLFAATDAANGRELWAYSGSGAPTRISQIAAGAASSSPFGLKTIGATTYFAAASALGNFELYKTDGATTTLVSDVNTGNDGSAPIGFTDIGNGNVLFLAFTNAQGFEPFVTNGSGAGTLPLKNLNTESNGGFGEGVTLGGWTYFSAYGKDTGAELYRTNGTTTNLVANIEPGVLGSSPSNLVANSSWVYFTANTIANGSKLWRTNGTTTEIATSVNPVTESDGASNLVATTAGDIYFTTSTAAGASLRKMGAGNTNTEVRSFGATGSILSLQTIGNDLFLSARDGSGNSNSGVEPWKVSAAGVATALGDINPGAGSSAPYEFAKTSNGDIYFAAFSPAAGYEPYRVANGSTTPTLVGDINPGAESSNVAKMTSIGNLAVFAAYNGTSLNIYKSDGTSAGTVENQALDWQSFGALRPLDAHEMQTDSAKPNLDYKDYLSLTKLDTAAGSSLYMASPFARRLHEGPYVTANGGNGVACWPDEVTPPGRYIYQFHVPGTEPFKLADASSAYGPAAGGRNPSRLNSLEDINYSLSADYGPTCPYDYSSFGVVNPDPTLYAAPMGDARISQFEEVTLGTANGRLYIGGYRPQNGGYEVWSMAHAESFTKRLNQYGMQDRRILKYEGTFDVAVGTFKFQPSGTSMLVQGYDATAKRQRNWKLQ